MGGLILWQLIKWQMSKAYARRQQAKEDAAAGAEIGLPTESADDEAKKKVGLTDRLVKVRWIAFVMRTRGS